MIGRGRAPGLCWLIGVGVAFLATQLALFSLRRAPSWDEAIYLSQVVPGKHALAFAPSRARGITLLAAPIAAAGLLVGVRLLLAAASAAGLVCAVWIWYPIVGPAAPLAAVSFGFSWLALFYGSEVMPNLWVALLGLAATGAAVRANDEGGRWNLAAGGLLCIMAVFRPPDALVLSIVLVVIALASGHDRLRIAGALAGGLALGWLPWLVEMSVRFGGPLEALRRAGSVGHVTTAGIGERLLQYAALSDGPTLGPVIHPRVPPLAVLWWGGTFVLAGVALLRTRGTAAFRPLLVASLTGLSLAAAYVVFVAGLAPRFLLPASALLSVPAAAGAWSLWRARRNPALTRGVVLSLGVVWLGLQTVTAHRIGAEELRARRAAQEVGLTIAQLSSGRACAVASSEDWPQIAFAAGCAGGPLPAAGENRTALTRALRGNDLVYVVLRSAPPAGSPLAAIPLRQVRTGTGGAWFILQLPRR